MMQLGLEIALERRKRRVDLLRGILSVQFVETTELVLEIGCGHGDFLVAFASAHPNQVCLGIDLISKRIRKATRKKERLRLPNLTFLKAEALETLDALPDTVGIAKTFLLFPDPWPKTKHHKNRIIQNPFLKQLASMTLPGGQLFFRTDHCGYFEWSRTLVEEHPDWVPESQWEKFWPLEIETFFQKFAENYKSLVARPDRDSEKSPLFSGGLKNGKM